MTATPFVDRTGDDDTTWQAELTGAQRGEPAPWHCICGAGDDAEMHSLMCVAANATDDEWYGEHPPRECDHDNGECHDVEHQR